MSTLVRKWEESVKTFLTPGVLFEELGFRYFGPIDGHDIDGLIDTFAAVRNLKGPRLVPSGRTMWRSRAAARRRMCKSASRLVNSHRPFR